jgi:hypothetical protein
MCLLLLMLCQSVRHHLRSAVCKKQARDTLTVLKIGYGLIRAECRLTLRLPTFREEIIRPDPRPI